MDICIGASYGSLVPMLSINLENTLALFGLNSKTSLCGVDSKYISRSYMLSEKLAKIPAKDHSIYAMVFIHIKVYSNILCQ